MNHFSRIFFVVAFSLFLQFFFNPTLYLGKSLEAILETPESLVNAFVDAVVVVSGIIDDLVDCGWRDLVFSAQIARPHMLHKVFIGQLLSLDRG